LRCFIVSSHAGNVGVYCRHNNKQFLSGEGHVYV
jgi:hypothetical protein